MKCFLVVNQLNDPFYIDYDIDFAEYIIRQAKIKGMLQHDTDITELDANLVMQLFSPLVNSQWLLIDQRKELCTSIYCPNGFWFAFRQVEDLLFITINGDEKESEAFLHRKMDVFITLMRFMFGPVSEEMGQSHAYSKRAKWDFHRQIMRNWAELVETEQSYLVEAIERLNVNQVVNEKCVEILEKSVKQMQAIKDHPIQHALLLVNSKLLALYSNRNAYELQSKDILAVMILARTMYPHSDRLEDLFSRQYMAPQRSRASTIDENSDGGEDEYHSAPNTPGGQRSRSPNVKPEHTKSGFSKYSSTLNKTEEASDSRTPRTSVSQFSASDSETLKNAGLSDQESSSRVGSQDSGPTLLEMYAEKYPDTVFSKPKTTTSPQHDEAELNEDKSVACSKVIEAEVHREADAKDATPDLFFNDGLELVFEQEDTSKFDNADGARVPADLLRGISSNTNDNESRASTVSTESGGELLLPSRSSSGGVEVHEIEKSFERSVQRNKRVTPNIGIPQAMNSSTPSLSSHNRPSSVATSALETSSFLQESIFTQTNPNSYSPQTIFLETPTCQYSPYNIHTVQILPGVTLVLLSQVQRHNIADIIYLIIYNIHDLIYGRRVKLSRPRSSYAYDTLNSLLSRLHSSLKKSKGRVNALSGDIHARWEKENLKQKLMDYMETDIKLQSELESQLKELSKKLKELFSHLFLSPFPHSPQFWNTLSQIKMGMLKELSDYREYLNVKAQRNITMTCYIDDFPGLIHFIYIDRHFHQMSAPSLNISLKDGESIDATTYLKQKIWSRYEHMMCKLTEGYTTVILREGDFYFSYFLWFEDYMRNPLPVQDSFKANIKFPYPGILSGSFYRDLLQLCFPHAIQGSVHCFEMFLMHIGTVHPKYIADHCKRLAHKMWEMSGEAYNSVSLI
ncbi:BLOC-3 complex member HPS1-like isoform X2 [Physella acuta]|uniref:BLOC-3 complex member HPS1-like isoform X2 n=1 Tax=Physella acuta TaxID=109671 RepID=UPI0027DD63BA|nr:BLOC-3 complex member HPS1-like isoform X2 [Physella acuta]